MKPIGIYHNSEKKNSAQIPLIQVFLVRCKVSKYFYRMYLY